MTNKRPLLRNLIPISQLCEWYVQQKRSAPEIQEIIKKEYGASYTRQAIHQYIKNNVSTRSQKDSMRVRVYKGRIDHLAISKKIDYKNRPIDYEEMRKRLGYRWAIGLDHLLCWSGAVKELAYGIGSTERSVSAWRCLRYRISPRFQTEISRFYGVSEEKIFSDVKDREIPRRGKGHSVNQIARLRNEGWRYPASHVKQCLYNKASQTMKDFAKILRIKEKRPYLADKFKGRVLMTPREQILTSRFLREPLSKLFPDYDPIALRVFADGIEDDVERNLAISIINCELWKN